MHKLSADSKRMLSVFAAGFFVVVHYSSVVYLNSSIIERYVGSSSINILYALGSLLSLVFLFLSPLLIRNWGSKKSFAIFIVLEILATLALGFSGAAATVALFFILHHSGSPILSFFMDLNLEQGIKQENTTGRTRGAFLTVQNIAWVASPLLIPLLQNKDQLKNVYLVSSLILIPLLAIVLLVFKNIKTNPETEKLEPFAKIKELLKKGDVLRIVALHFTLNIFYSWMVIYLPLFLNKEVGLGWEKIGVMFTIMLLPFLFFEFPTGVLNDKVMGEKELLAFGLIIISLTTLLLPLSAGKNFLLIAFVLFLTRTGASIVEISSESYFFKKVKEKETSTISLFRMVRPVSFLVVPFIVTPIIQLYGYGNSFYALGALVLLGLFFIPKVDTR